jgi:hypothetical protein
MKKHFLFLFFMVVFGSNAVAQTVSVGVLGGVPLLDRAPGNDQSRPYVVGPSVELRLPANFAIEADALYQRVGNTPSFVSVLGASQITAYSVRQRGNDWEFPLLAKYYFKPVKLGWQPFVGTGYAFRTVGVHSSSTTTQILANPTVGTAQTVSSSSDFRSALGVGVVVAAGVRFRAGHFAVLPEFRYTHWGGNSDNITRKNEAALMLGLTF